MKMENFHAPGLARLVYEDVEESRGAAPPMSLPLPGVNMRASSKHICYSAADQGAQSRQKQRQNGEIWS